MPKQRPLSVSLLRSELCGKSPWAKGATIFFVLEMYLFIYLFQESAESDTVLG